jgi:hypothetical protein
MSSRCVLRILVALTIVLLGAMPSVGLEAAPGADTTPPVITPNVSGTLGNDGWYVSDVTVSWSAVDSESEISSSSGCDPTTIDNDTAGMTLTCTATSAGGTSSESVTIKRDATPPTFTWHGDINDGDAFYYGFVPPKPTCSAEDALSGLAYPWSWGGYANIVGTHALTAMATDRAGNRATETRTYTVLAWTLTGFYRPVVMGSTVWNSAKGGSTVPLKFDVYAGTTELTSTGDIRAFEVNRVDCSATGLGDTVDWTATGGTSLHYDAIKGQFVQYWQTPRGAGCYVITVTTRDGSSLSANFRLK